MATFDVHLEKPDGGPGKLLETVDRVPELRKKDSFVEFGGKMYRVLSGTYRGFIIVTQERWARVSAASWRKA